MGFSASGFMIRISREGVSGVGSEWGALWGVERSYRSDLEHLWSDARLVNLDYGRSFLGRAEREDLGAVLWAHSVYDLSPPVVSAVGDINFRKVPMRFLKGVSAPSAH